MSRFVILIFSHAELTRYIFPYLSTATLGLGSWSSLL